MCVLQTQPIKLLCESSVGNIKWFTVEQLAKVAVGSGVFLAYYTVPALSSIDELTYLGAFLGASCAGSFTSKLWSYFREKIIVEFFEIKFESDLGSP